MDGPILSGSDGKIRAVTSAAPASSDAALPPGVVAWAQYAKDRHESAEKRLADFRGWARQLAAAVGVVVGLEAALIGQVVRIERGSGLALGICLVLLLGTVAWQLVIMNRAVAAGYVGKDVVGPENPAVVYGHLEAKDDAETRRMIGAYYANASGTVHAAAEEVGREMRSVANRFRWSLWLLFSAIALTAGMAVLSQLRNQ